MHACPALASLNLPLVEVANPDEAPDARNVIVYREDYANGLPVVASIRTEHGSGRVDCTAMAPTARLIIESKEPN